MYFCICLTHATGVLSKTLLQVFVFFVHSNIKRPVIFFFLLFFFFAHFKDLIFMF